MTRFAKKCFANSAAWLAWILIVLAAASPIAAQKNKDKNKNQPAPDSQSMSDPSKTDSQVIDQMVGEALGYWQIGDLDSLHKFYADDVVVVSGLWEPPLIGWANYAKAYEDQRSHVTGGRMERSNTLIKVAGNSAWATYQFIYVVMVEGKVAQFRGHTTLIFNKQGDHWLIVLNHSSIVDSSTPSQNQTTPAERQPEPGKP